MGQIHTTSHATASSKIPAEAQEAVDLPAGEVQHPYFWDGLKIICRVGATLLFDLKAWGTHHVPKKGGAIIVSNHQSFLDPILLGVRLRRPVSYMARSDLFSKPAFTWLIRQLNAFPVRRGESDLGAMKQAIARVQQGRVLIMFPEGTRTSDGNVHALQPGIGLLARRADVPVIPAVIDGSFAAWPRGQFLPYPHPIRVMYGAPLAIEGLKASQIVELIGQTLPKMLDELRRIGEVS
jgi:1-acyl-sn-glycerol-3-phosphate acyltransferase